MYIEVALSNGEVIEFWGVRSWNYNGSGVLWIYFINPILPDGSNCGYIKFAEVKKSFVADGYNMVEHLAYIQ